MRRVLLASVLFLLAVSPGKAQTVLFEESHRPLCTVNGQNPSRDGNCYTQFATLLEDNGYTVLTLDSPDPITPAALAGVDCFFTYPGRTFLELPYLTSELDALESFVRNDGGGALLLGEWNALSGLEPLANRFGVSLADAALTDSDPEDHIPPSGNGWVVFDRAEGEIADHPATMGVDQAVLLATNVLDANTEGAMEIMRSDATSSHPDAPVAVADDFGAGRVIVTGDGSQFEDRIPANLGTLPLDLADNAQLALSFASYVCGPRPEPPDGFIDVTPETINVSKEGVIPVVIFGTDEFDVSSVNVATLAFGPQGAGPVHAGGHLEDVNGDARIDLVTHYLASETGIELGNTTACLVGTLLDGAPIGGCDTIRTVSSGSGR